MIDIDKIGQRIKEQRKHIVKVSQEKMAEDLNMYQADISNMENAKSGSGITDLLKLDLIADYFGISLESLLFGLEDASMLTYHGDKMALKGSRKKMPKSHWQVLSKLTGHKNDSDFSPLTYECGPYTLYSTVEQQKVMGSNSSIKDGGIVNPDFVLEKLHTFVFFGLELVGVMVTSIRSIDARANSLWRTLGEFLSSDYSHHVKISYSAMLIA